MTFESCIAGIRTAAGGVLTDDEILELLEEMDAASQAILRERPWANIQQELLGYSERLGKQAREAALIEKRNKLLNADRGKALRELAERPEYAKDPRKALVAKDIGALGNAPGGRLSVAQQSLQLARHWVGSLMNEIDKADLRKALRDQGFARNVAREMWELGRKGGKVGVTGSKEAAQAAKIIHGLQETMVARLNRAGAWIRRMPGYIVRQTNDADKIRKGGFNAWLATVDGRVDEVRTFGRQLNPDEMQEIYGKIYQRLASGLPLDGVAVDLMDAAPFKKGFNLAKKVSQHRELHFKSADAWWEYNEKYGVGGLLDGVHAAIVGSARNVALMEAYGTNPRLLRDGWIKELEEAASKAGAKAVNSGGVYTPEAMWLRISGEGLRSANRDLAMIGQSIRNWNVVSKLGAVLVASFGDTPIMQRELARHGVPVLQRFGSSVANLLSYAEGGDKQRLANSLLAYSEGVSSSLFARFDPEDGVGGLMSKAMRQFWKITGASYWTDAHRAGVARSISNAMAVHLESDFAALPTAYKRLLEAYDVSAKDWERLRQGIETHNGQKFAVPSSVPLEAFGNLSSPAGRRAARLERDRFLNRLEGFLSDRLDSAILNPGAREMIGVTFGLSAQAHPAAYEFMKLIAQFKAFPAAVVTRVWGDHLKESDYLGLIGTIFAMTVMGHLTTVTRDYLAGKAPVEIDGPGTAAQVFARAMVAGGGATIFGDLILGEYNRFGRSALASLAGPTFGQIDSVAELIWRWKKAVANDDKTADAASASVRFLLQNTPGANLFYIRTALNYLLVYPFMEWLNPGSLRRMEQATEKNSGQKYILPPSQVAPSLS